MCVCLDLNVGAPTWVKSKKKKKKKKGKVKLRCQITGWKALAATKSSFEFMPQRDQTGRYFGTNKF